MSNAREKILEIAKTLPPAPRVLVELDVMLRDLDAPLEDITQLIKRDAALSSNVIRVSNSVAYGAAGETRVGEIEEAVTRIGFREIHRLVSYIAMERLIERDLVHYGVPSEFLREHMLFTALMCEALAEQCQVDPRRAYTVGLMRTLGILVLDRVAEAQASVPPYDRTRHASYAAWEGMYFGMSHREIAALILGEWGFPQEIIDGVRGHYLVDKGDDTSRLACVAHLASAIVARNARGMPGEPECWSSEARAISLLDLDRQALDLAARRTQKELARYGRHLGIELLQSPEEPSAAAEVHDATATEPVTSASDTAPVETTAAEPAPAGEMATTPIAPITPAAAQPRSAGWWDAWSWWTRAAFLVLSIGGLTACVAGCIKMRWSPLDAAIGPWTAISERAARSNRALSELIEALSGFVYPESDVALIQIAALGVAFAAAGISLSRLVFQPLKRLPSRH